LTRVSSGPRKDLTGKQWRVLEPLLPTPSGRGRPRKWSRRQLIDGIRWRTRVGARLVEENGGVAVRRGRQAIWCAYLRGRGAASSAKSRDGVVQHEQDSGRSQARKTHRDRVPGDLELVPAVAEERCRPCLCQGHPSTHAEGHRLLRIGLQA
jgi:hypothetical protein